jgi:hypothetical protein
MTEIKTFFDKFMNEATCPQKRFCAIAACKKGKDKRNCQIHEKFKKYSKCHRHLLTRYDKKWYNTQNSVA